jgi:hypothetical protein
MILLGRMVVLGLGLVIGMGTARAQQIAITIDDLPAHGELPPGMTRLKIAESMLKTIHAEKLPLVYGFVNGRKVEEDPTTLAVLKAWRPKGEPLGDGETKAEGSREQ